MILKINGFQSLNFDRRDDFFNDLEELLTQYGLYGLEEVK